VSIFVADIETGALKKSRDEPGGCPSIGQAVSGMEAARARSAAPTWNVGRRVPTLSLSHRLVRDRERERAEQQKLRGAEYRRGTRWRTGS